MLDEEFNPYDKIKELEKFAKAADKHIAQLHKNQGQILIAINELSQTIQDQTQRITEISNELYNLHNRSTDETSRKKR